MLKSTVQDNTAFGVEITMPFEELQRQIATNSPAENLGLSWALDPGESTPENISNIITWLALNRSVVSISFDGVSLTPEHIEKLAHLLMRDTTLRTINLGHQNIDSKGLGQLAYALAVNSGLERLYLGSDLLDDKGLLSFAKALTQNQHLIQLNIGYNQVTPRGTIGFCEMLTGKNHTLQELRLSIPFDALALRALTALLRASGIKRLYMGSPLYCSHTVPYPAPDEEARRIKELCDLIRTAPLQTLCVGSAGLRGKHYQLVSALRENTTLTSVEITTIIFPFASIVVKRNTAIANCPGKRDAICEEYREQLDTLQGQFAEEVATTVQSCNPAGYHLYHQNNGYGNGNERKDERDEATPVILKHQR